MSDIFVLLATFFDPDPIPNEIWTFSDQAKAENFLKGWAEDFLGGYTHDANDLPADAELVAAFRNAGAYVYLYRCHLDLVDGGSSEELRLFERAPEPQPQS
jgi:hypothetical protein